MLLRDQESFRRKELKAGSFEPFIHGEENKRWRVMEALIRSRGNVIKFVRKSTQVESNVNDSCPVGDKLTYWKDFIDILQRVHFEQEEALNSLDSPSRLA